MKKPFSKPPDHTAYSSDHHLEPYVDFDFDEVDRNLSGSKNESKREIVTAAMLLHHIIAIGGTRPDEFFIWVNAFLFVVGIHPNQELSAKEIGASLGLNKPEFHRRVGRIRTILSERGLYLPVIHWQRKPGSTEKLKAAAMRHLKEIGEKPRCFISDADRKLNWIADYMHRINTDDMKPLARKALKSKLIPLVKIYDKL